ncbi:heat shock 70 kDa protein 12A-like [Mytilus edulis]|uniref:heat shock 70 kDa protein 12A-like n=1 Tax=Mytilus edulis TaxID=6550 RepID=UPI0039EED3A1
MRRITFFFRFKDNELGVSLRSPKDLYEIVPQGGTIDVTSYEVQNDSELKELSEPSGGPWGRTFVDQEYESFLKDLFGKDVWETYIKQCPEDFLDIKRKFEAKKRGIKESQKPKTIIPYQQSLYQTYCKIRKSQSFQEDLKKSVHCKTVTATNEKLRYEPGVVNKFFLKSVDSIISHVQSLLTPTLKKRQGRHITSILMVGGFSDSPFLFERVKKEFHYLEIICPQDAVLAVLKGDVMFGHNPELISERICPRTYGITVNVPYDDKKHPERLKCLIEGREICSDLFKTIAKKGDHLTVGKTKYTILCSPTRSTYTKATVEVYESEKVNPVYLLTKAFVV